MRVLLGFLILLGGLGVDTVVMAADKKTDHKEHKKPGDKKTDGTAAQQPADAKPATAGQTGTPKPDTAKPVAATTAPASTDASKSVAVAKPADAKTAATTTPPKPAPVSSAPASAAKPATTKAGTAQPAAKPAAKSEEIEEYTLDTVDVENPSGNWLLKRIWWEKAEDRYDKIRKKVEEVMGLRMGFFNKRSDLEKNVLDPFYQAIGMGQGELSVIIPYLIKEMEKLKARQGSFTKKEQEFLTLVSAQQKTLEQLNLDVKAISDVDNELEKALNQLMEQINLARNYEQQAWNNFKTIAKELSDKKARELYYGMENFEGNIDDILNYIKKPFSAAFDQLIKTAKDQTERIKSAVQSLKEQGLDFGKQAKQMEEDAYRLEKSRAQQEKERAVEEAVEKTKEEMSIMGRLSGVLDSVVSGAQSAWNWVTGFFGGTTQEPEAVAEKPAMAAAVPSQPHEQQSHEHEGAEMHAAMPEATAPTVAPKPVATTTPVMPAVAPTTKPVTAMPVSATPVAAPAVKPSTAAAIPATTPSVPATTTKPAVTTAPMPIKTETKPVAPAIPAATTAPNAPSVTAPTKPASTTAPSTPIAPASAAPTASAVANEAMADRPTIKPSIPAMTDGKK